jgi:protein KRI1
VRDKLGDASGESDDDDEDDGPEDEDGALVTPQLDQQVFRTLSLIKARDPRVYDPSKHFFSGTYAHSLAQCMLCVCARTRVCVCPCVPVCLSLSFLHSIVVCVFWCSCGSGEALAAQPKPMYLRDYERKRMLEEGPEVFGRTDADDDDAVGTAPPQAPTYAAEQEALRAAVRRAGTGGAGKKHADEDEDDGELFVPRTRTEAEQAAEDDDFRSFLLTQEKAVGHRSRFYAHVPCTGGSCDGVAVAVVVVLGPVCVCVCGESLYVGGWCVR